MLHRVLYEAELKRVWGTQEQIPGKEILRFKDAGYVQTKNLDLVMCGAALKETMFEIF